jgi:hypothetical protein
MVHSSWFHDCLIAIILYSQRLAGTIRRELCGRAKFEIGSKRRAQQNESQYPLKNFTHHGIYAYLKNVL